MKTKLLLIFLVIILTGCSFAPYADDVVKVSDDIVRVGQQNGDEIIRQLGQNADTLGSHSDELAVYWRNQIASSGSLIYKSAALSSKQSDFVEILRANAYLTDDEAHLVLQTSCNIYGYIEDYAQPPEKSYVQQYVETIINNNSYNISFSDPVEWADSIQQFAIDLIELGNYSSLQEGAQILFRGYCLLSN